MVAIKTVRGLGRFMFLLRVKLAVLGHFLPLLWSKEQIKGPRLSPRRFILFLRRLLLFLSKLDHNKFVRSGQATRMDLYVPSFPSPAFFWGARKFVVFDGLPPPVTVLISVTSACRFACEHCYQRFDRGHDVSLEVLLGVVRRLQEEGVAFFNVEGGEPFLVYERLKAVCAAIDRRSEVWVNSTGDGMTTERLRELKRLNLSAVMFSLHTPEPAKLNAFMHSPKAWDTMVHGVQSCHEAEVPVAFNVCLGREGFHNGDFEKIMDKARHFKACLVQLIKPKPAGAWLDAGPELFSSADFRRMTELVRRYNYEAAYRDYPAISAQVLEEERTRFGCTAGGVDRFYINAKGDVQPCEFLNISFGNIAREEFAPIFARMRQSFDPPGETWLCEACALHISKLHRSSGSGTLPLSPECTAEVCAKWERGAKTGFYERIRQLS